MSASEHLSGQQFYLRAGALPPTGRSRNYATGETERGVSVYETDDHGWPKTPTEGEWSHDDLHYRLNHSDETPWHVIQGRVAGRGGEGEPVLRDAKVVGHWNPALRIVHDRRR